MAYLEDKTKSLRYSSWTIQALSKNENAKTTQPMIPCSTNSSHYSVASIVDPRCHLPFTYLPFQPTIPATKDMSFHRKESQPWRAIARACANLSFSLGAESSCQHLCQGLQAVQLPFVHQHVSSMVLHHLGTPSAAAVKVLQS